MYRYWIEIDARQAQSGLIGVVLIDFFGEEMISFLAKFWHKLYEKNHKENQKLIRSLHYKRNTASFLKRPKIWTKLTIFNFFEGDLKRTKS